METVEIAGKKIGVGHPVFVVAEVGFLFQSFEPKNGHPGAKDLIDKAFEAGADAVKFQTFRGETWLAPHMVFDMENTGKVNGRELVRPYEIDEATHKEIFDYAKEKRRIVFSTPSHPTDVDLLEKFDPPVYKIGSDDLTNLPLLRYIAFTNRPIILSTGMSTLAEVDKAIETILPINSQLALLHCVSNYPTYPEDVNLRSIVIMREKFSLPVGWSDHTVGSSAVVLAAVTLGANIIEEHFNCKVDNPSPDAMYAANKEQFTGMVSDIRIIEKSLGTPGKRPTERGNVRLNNRKSIVAGREISAGEILTLTNPYILRESLKYENNFLIARPGNGLAPGLLLSNRKIRARKNIAPWQTVTSDDVEFLD